MERNPRKEAQRLEATQPPEVRLKPYFTPRLTEHGKLAAVTADQSPSELPTSDRNAKEGFAPVDPRAILARVATLPIETWSYKGETARHLGPMAQDFAAAFGLGADDRHIFPLDAGGVALAAIQGLHALVQAQGTRLQALERELTALRSGEASRSTASAHSSEAYMDQDREEATSLTRPEPDVLTAADGKQASGRARKAYVRPGLTTYGRVPAHTLAALSVSEDEPPSDRNAKEGFAPVDPRAILTRVATLPIETWSYKGETARHLGPMAQDFAAAFGLGQDDRHIFPLDAGNVALAAIQGLHGLVQVQSTRLKILEREVTALRTETTALRLELVAREGVPVA